MTTEERQIESEAKALYDNGVITVDTPLIWACFEKDVMRESDIANWLSPKAASANDCRKRCVERGIDVVTDINSMERGEIEAWLSDVILFGTDKLSTDDLRQVLILLANDDGEHGTGFWRRFVEAEQDYIYEWWSVEEWLGEDLIADGEYVLSNSFGYWWGRCTAGQHMLMDGVFQSVIRRKRKTK